ncbi:MAG TPA: PPOX class F420-dependent oxidoreductase [Gaiellaceae bacterium]|nr:PPOX class F420-dependent oxidoreductase [Gaiellaceae bacterium]
MYTELSDLAAARYISITTRRRDGSLASTPVWVVSDDGRRLLVWTHASTWKVKRIRRDPRVLVAKSNYRGRERGPRIEGNARVVDDVDVQTLIREKYGWQKRLLERLARGKPDTSVTIAIVDA